MIILPLPRTKLLRRKYIYLISMTTELRIKGKHLVARYEELRAIHEFLLCKQEEITINNWEVRATSKQLIEESRKLITALKAKKEYLQASNGWSNKQEKRT